jgi:cytoskeletal protein RodZ
MNETLLLVVVIIVLLAVVGWLLYERRRTTALRSKFGPEYERAVEDVGDRRAAEGELRKRQERVQALEIRPLGGQDRQRYATEWRQVQALFVDEPKTAIDDADDLIGRLMEARGYPVADFEQRVADISVDHAVVAQHYRTAHAIAERRDEVDTDTEALRQAMVHYRALFEDLLGPTDGQTAEPVRPPVTSDQPEVTSDQPEVTSDQPEVTSDQPEVTSDQPEVTSDQPEVTSDQPKATPDQPEATRRAS